MTRKILYFLTMALVISIINYDNKPLTANAAISNSQNKLGLPQETPLNLFEKPTKISPKVKEMKKFFPCIPGARLTWRVKFPSPNLALCYIKLYCPIKNNYLIKTSLYNYIYANKAPPDGYQLTLRIGEKHELGWPFNSRNCYLMHIERDDIGRYDMADKLYWMIDYGKGVVYEITFPKPKLVRGLPLNINSRPAFSIRIIFYLGSWMSRRYIPLNPEDATSFLGKVAFKKKHGVLLNRQVKSLASKNNKKTKIYFTEIMLYLKNYGLYKLKQYIDDKPTMVWERIE